MASERRLFLLSLVMDKYLKAYLKNNFDFKALKKVGFFGKDVKSADYEKQAERLCHRFGFKNIYEWSLNRPVELIHPIGIATGVFKNTFGEDVLKLINQKQST